MSHNKPVDLSGKRFASAALDYLVIFTAFFLYVSTFGEPNAAGGKTVTGIAATVPFFIWFCWLVIPEVIFGTTPGHYINGLKIISMDGSKPRFTQAMRRRLCDAVEIT